MVYLIRSGDTDMYKIGYTSGQIKKRMKSLQTGCPYPLSIVKVINDNQHKEKWLHEKFDMYRKHGEWFKLDNETLIDVCDSMDEENIKLGDAISKYLQHRDMLVLIGKLNKSTLQRDKNALKLLVKFLKKSKSVVSICVNDIENGLIPYMTNKISLRKNNLKTDQIRHDNATLRHIKTFFNWMYETEKIIPKRIRFKICEYKIVPRYFSKKQLDDIYSLLPNKVRRYYQLLEKTGMRPSEPFLGDFLDNGLYFIPKDRAKAGERRINIPEDLVETQLELIQIRNQYLNKCNQNWQKINERIYDTYHRPLYKVLKKIGLSNSQSKYRYSPHSFRHRFGSLLYKRTKDIKNVMINLGYGNLSETLRTYTKFNLDIA